METLYGLLSRFNQNFNDWNELKNSGSATLVQINQLRNKPLCEIKEIDYNSYYVVSNDLIKDIRKEIKGIKKISDIEKLFSVCGKKIKRKAMWIPHIKKSLKAVLIPIEDEMELCLSDEILNKTDEDNEKIRKIIQNYKLKRSSRMPSPHRKIINRIKTKDVIEEIQEYVELVADDDFESYLSEYIEEELVETCNILSEKISTKFGLEELQAIEIVNKWAKKNKKINAIEYETNFNEGIGLIKKKLKISFPYLLTCIFRKTKIITFTNSIYCNNKEANTIDRLDLK
ncbi:MAG: hypothetical protein ACTSRP_03275 [Candidatus Helarchaeota archaeon]